MAVLLKVQFLNSLYGIVPGTLFVTLLSSEWYRKSLMRSQDWFMQWLGAVRQQAITWSNVDPDLCCHIVSLGHNELTHCSLVMPYSGVEHMGSGNDLSPVQCQAITWTNTDISNIQPIKTNFSEVLITIKTFSFMKMHLKVSSATGQPYCLGLTLLMMKNYLLLQWSYLNNRHYHRNCTQSGWVEAIMLNHWGRVTHICIGKLTIIGSDNGLSPGRRQAIIWTNAGILLIEPLGTSFSEILIGIQIFFIQENALENVVCEMASILSRPQGRAKMAAIWQITFSNAFLWMNIFTLWFKFH